MNRFTREQGGGYYILHGAGQQAMFMYRGFEVRCHRQATQVPTTYGQRQGFVPVYKGFLIRDVTVETDTFPHPAQVRKSIDAFYQDIEMKFGIQHRKRLEAEP